MISDANVTFTCDQCYAEQDVVLPVVVRNRMPIFATAHWEDLLPRGWTSISHDKHLCDSCLENQ